MQFDPETPSTLFVAFVDPPPERDAEFNEWYDTIHGPDALANGSFTALHRFRAVGAGHRAGTVPRASGRAGCRVRGRGLGLHRTTSASAP